MDQLDQLLDEARLRLQDSPYDIAHDLVHHLEVLRNALQLAHDIKDPKIDFDALRVAAMWHDVPHQPGAEKSSEATANYLKLKMQQMGFDKDFINKVYDAVLFHSFSQEPITIEGKILYDADKLELLNAARIIRYGKAVEAGKISPQKAKKDIEWLAKAYKLLRDRLHFDVSKSRYDQLMSKLKDNSAARAVFQKFGQTI
jgi:HD superfamily phosphohydrolase YqeK